MYSGKRRQGGAPYGQTPDDAMKHLALAKPLFLFGFASAFSGSSASQLEIF
jgi:hypothetical protein